MNVAIVGYGSIGKRHANNCRKLGYNVDIFSKHKKKTLKKTHYDLLIIASITVDHEKDALRFKDLSENFLIEKPLAATAAGGKSIRKVLHGKKIFVGYCLLFNPIICEAKKLLDKNIIGKVFSCDIHCGSFLPDWRKGDYRTSYSAKKDEGGGILLDSIHEINYSQFLFKTRLKHIIGYSDKISDLEISSDDIAFAIFKTGEMYINVSLNYFQKPSQRYIKVFGEKGTIVVDLIGNRIQVFDQSNSSSYDKRWKFDGNEMYINEIKYVTGKIKSDKDLDKFIGIDQGIKDLEIIESLTDAA